MKYVLIIVLLLFVTPALSGCSVSREIVNAFKSKEQFLSLSEEPRIFYEPGAEAFASRIKAILPAAIGKVEKAHYRAFQKPVEVYLCATTESFV